MLTRKAARTDPDLSLAQFFRQAWSIVDPADLSWNWHIDAVCEVLTAVAKGEIRDLVINQPPRSGKSTAASVMFPAWLWTWDPRLKLFYASYSSELSGKHSRLTRELIRAPWYQGQWGGRFQVKPEKDNERRFENDRGGYRIATSVTGMATGEGGDIIFVDDAIAASDGESEAVRERANTWWTETMPSRRNDVRTGRRVIVMQRLHESDLTGLVLREGTWEMLCLPQEYDPLRTQLVSTPRIQAMAPDPRTEDGELLDKGRWGPEELAKLKDHDTTPYSYAGQYQQMPAPRGGGILRRDWFEVVPKAPERLVRVRYWDKAATKGGVGARTAGVLMGRDPRSGVYYIEDVAKGRWSIDERDREILNVAVADGKKVTVYTEQEPGSGGKESAENTVRMLPGYIVKIDRVTGDKTLRAQPLASQASVGMVKVVAGEWNGDWFAEIETFPMGRLKDQVDATSGAFNKLVELRRGNRTAMPVGLGRRSLWGNAGRPF